ncbi:MAG: hypothetical protein HW416_240 [Chloroflexi bacterium]|nr:hypothetical protein [Chloroflexota bacterium]
MARHNSYLRGPHPKTLSKKAAQRIIGLSIDGRGPFSPKRDVLPSLVLEGVHFLFHDISHLAGGRDAIIGAPGERLEYSRLPKRQIPTR